MAGEVSESASVVDCGVFLSMVGERGVGAGGGGGGRGLCNGCDWVWDR